MSIQSVDGADWLARLDAAKAGPELLALLVARIERPYDEGPAVNERAGEVPEEVFERRAATDENFRARLDETIRQYFDLPASDPSNSQSIVVTRALLDVVQRRALSGAYPTLRAWFAKHDAFLRREPGGHLARAALGALATAQLPGTADGREFWLKLWQSGPAIWQPKVFIGLRLMDPAVAAEQIPEMVRRARAEKKDPAALLHGFWNQQPGGRDAILQWLKKNEGQDIAEEVRTALRKRVEDTALSLLAPSDSANRRHKPAPRLVSLASQQAPDFLR